MGRAAHLPRETRPSLTRGTWNTGRVRVRAAAVALVAALVAPAAAARRRCASSLERALRVPHVSLAATGAVAVDLDDRRDRLLAQRLAAAPPGLEREARRHLRGADGARARRSRSRPTSSAKASQIGTTWQGDLVLKGYGDPTLSAADLTVLARQVRAAGIVTRHRPRARRRVVVRLAPHGRRLEGGVLHHGVAAALGAHRRSRPRRALHVARSRARGDAALPRGARARRRARRRRPRCTAPPTTRPSRSRPSTRRTLAAIVRWMDRVSDNFVAEMLVKQLGAVQAGARHDRRRRRRHDRPARGRPASRSTGVRLVDGSGLSLLDRLTPNALVSLLSAMWNDLEVRLELLAVAAGRGTHRHAARPHARPGRRPASCARRPGRPRTRPRCRASSATATSSRSCRTASPSRSRGRASRRTASRWC